MPTARKLLRHRRIHRAGAQVGTVELVDDARHAGELRAQHVGEGVDAAKVVALKLVARVEPRRIPAEGHALRLRAADGLADPEILTHVVEDELLAAGTAHGFSESIYVRDRALKILRVMPGFVDQLDEEDRRLVLEGDTCIRIYVIQDLAQVVHLGGDRGGIGAHLLFAEMPAKAGRRRVPKRVRPIRAIELDGAEQHVDAAFARAGDQVVLQVQVVVRDQVAGAVGRFPVAPKRQPQAVPAHARELRHVLVDHLLAIGVDITRGAIVRRGRHDVVRSEERDFPSVVLPPDYACTVEIDGACRVRQPAVRRLNRAAPGSRRRATLVDECA